MRNINQRMWKTVFIGSDTFAMVLALLLAYYLRFESGLSRLYFLRIGENSRYLSLQIYTKQLLLLIPMYLLLMYLFSLYQQKRKKKSPRGVFLVVPANVFLGVFYLIFLYLTKTYEISRIFLQLFLLLNILLGVSARLLLLRIRRAIEVKD